MKKTVGCFTDEKLKELSEQPNTVVMQPTYDTVFTPWPAERVSLIVDQLAQTTKSKKNCSPEEIRVFCKDNKDFSEFSEKYKTMFEKLTVPDFVEDVDNLRVIKQMVLLKAAVDNNMTTAQEAQAQASDIALKSLSSRVKHSNKK